MSWARAEEEEKKKGASQSPSTPAEMERKRACLAWTGSSRTHGRGRRSIASLWSSAGGPVVWTCVQQHSGWTSKEVEVRQAGPKPEAKPKNPQGAERDPQGQRWSQLLAVRTPRTVPDARGKSFNQGFVYLSRAAWGGGGASRS